MTIETLLNENGSHFSFKKLKLLFRKLSDLRRGIILCVRGSWNELNRNAKCKKNSSSKNAQLEMHKVHDALLRGGRKTATIILKRMTRNVKIRSRVSGEMRGD